MAAALRRHAPRLQGALLRLSSTSSAAQEARAIPAEVAQLVSLRGPGMAILPPDIVAAVDQAAADSNRKAVKRRGQELSYRLRHMSRSKHRGGAHPNLSERLEAEANREEGQAAAERRQRRGKRRQARHQALELLTKSAAVPVTDSGSSKLPRLDEFWGPLRQVVSAEEAVQAAAERAAVASRSSIAEGGSLYDTPAALAYAASRLPACYAALHRTLGEVASRRPGWHPVTMLDFGAGPGTAVWAAQQVWRQQPLDALAVEPAGAMSWLGHEIQQRQRQQYEAAVQQRAAATAAAEHVAAAAAEAGSGEQEAGHAGLAGQEAEAGEEPELPAPPPRLRWMYKLPPRYRLAQGKQYDLVTAGYVLGELRSDTERRRLVEELWSRTADAGVLLLVEPGTPSGSAHIQQARTQLLELAAGEQAMGGAAAAGASQGQEQGQAAGAVAVAVGGSSSAAAVGAHVVAPCPHDGVCPMLIRPSWCHFVQRFQRTQLQRAAKASAGIQPRTYQDERFSYVAIARAPRPAAHERQQQPAVAGSFMPTLEDPFDFLQLPDHLTPRKIPEDARPLIMYSESEGEGEWELDGGSSSDSDSDSDSERDDSSSDSGSDSSSDSESGSEEEEGGLEAAAGGSGRLQASDAEVPAELAADLPAELAGLDAATRRLLLESVMEGAEEDEDEDEAELAARLQQLFEEEAAAWQAAAQGGLGSAGGGSKVASSLAPATAAAAVVLAPVSQATAQLLAAGERVDWQELEPEAVAAAQLASGGWSRVIRTPRKRSGHVVLDLCSVADGSGTSSSGRGRGSGQQGEGVLLRQIVSKAAARREGGGNAAYRLARRLRWGDLWPQHYQRSFRAEEAPTGLG